MRPPRDRSFAFVATLTLLALLTGPACGGSDESTGVEVTVAMLADAPQPTALRLSWWNESSALILDQHERIAPRTEGDDTVLATIRITVGEAPARRWVVVRGLGAAGEVVSEGAARVDAERGRWVHAEVRLQPGALTDDDRDGVPDIVDDCRGDRTTHAGCPKDAGARADARDAEGGSPADAVADGVDTRPPTDTSDGGSDSRTPDDAADVSATPDPRDATADVPTLDAIAEVDRPAGPDAADVPPDTGVACKAVLAVARTALNTPDTAVQTRLKTLGCVVTVKEERSLAAGDLAGQTLAVIGASAGSSASYAWLRSHATPLLVLEDRALPQLGMTGVTDDVHYGPAAMQTAVDVVAGSPLAGGLAGKQTILDMASDITWGAPPVNAIRGATVSGTAARLVVFGFEANGMMVDLKAPARRAAFLLEEAAIPKLNASGWKLFDATVSWLLGR